MNFSTKLGFRLLHPNQLETEYDINFNTYLMEFWLNPVISEFVENIPEEMTLGEAVIIDNESHPNDQFIILQMNNKHLIKPQNNMRIYWNQQFHYFTGKLWLKED